jgi:4-amino-4-deoxy-L-arabinose transferase-like glycosyltransferase
VNVKTTIIALALLLGTAAVYTSRLGDAPIYLAHDEVKFALQAESMASTGRSLSGERFPVYFTEPEFKGGRDPISIYAMALLLKFLPLSERSVRIPSTVVGVVNVMLVFLISRRVFHRDGVAVGAAAILATAPAHFIHSRMAYDVIYPLPFALAWVLCLLAYLEHGRLWALAGGALLLGLGIYSYLPALFMMPLYLGCTLGLVWFRQRSVRHLAVTVGAFVVALAPLAYWQVVHPERYAELLASYSPQFQSVRNQAAGFDLGWRVETYWNTFNPGYLFFDGDPSLINSTREAGVFLLAAAVPIVIGCWQLAAGGRSAERALVAIGLLTAPLAVVVAGVLEIRRVMLLLPFGALVAAYGLDWLMDSSAAWRRTVAAVTLGMVLLQFARFHEDYMGRYRADSARWFGGNLRDALLDVIDNQSSSPGPILLHSRIPYVDAYWDFYTQALRRGDLRDRVKAVDLSNPALLATAPHSWLVVDMQTVGAGLFDSTQWDVRARSTEPDGAVSFLVLQRQ